MARATLHYNHWKSRHSCIKFNLPVCYSHHFFLLLTQKTQQLKLHISLCYLLQSLSIRVRIFLILHLHSKCVKAWYGAQKQLYLALCVFLESTADNGNLFALGDALTFFLVVLAHTKFICSSNILVAEVQLVCFNYI